MLETLMGNKTVLKGIREDTIDVAVDRLLEDYPDNESRVKAIDEILIKAQAEVCVDIVKALMQEFVTDPYLANAVKKELADRTDDADLSTQAAEENNDIAEGEYYKFLAAQE